jgi:hypothetical protein
MIDLQHGPGGGALFAIAMPAPRSERSKADRRVQCDGQREERRTEKATLRRTRSKNDGGWAPFREGSPPGDTRGLP